MSRWSCEIEIDVTFESETGRSPLPIVVIGNDRTMDETMPSVGLLRDHGFELRMTGDDRFAQGHATDDEEIKVLKGASAVVARGERYPAAVLEALPELRVIARMGVGFDRVDIATATARRIAVTITPNANHEAVAEHAIALVMASAKYVVRADKAMRSGAWPNLPRRPVRGATLGIVGLGRIGRSLALRALGMRMRVIATELWPDAAFVAEHDIEVVDLDTLLGEADYVSLNCPLTDETRGFMNNEKLALMKPDAFLINTARGALVIEADLVDALASGRLGGAALDVFEQEPTPSDNPMYELDNVIVSPHIAGSDDKSVAEMGLEAAQNIIDLSNGRWPTGSVVNDELKDRWSW